MPNSESFSKRHNFYPAPTQITIREDAPEEVRIALIDSAYEVGWGPEALRTVVCRVLRKRPDASNWSPYPNIDHEVRGLIEDCPWYKVYDIIEAVYADIADNLIRGTATKFEKKINAAFLEIGVGWQMEDGEIISRGNDEYEAVVRGATHALTKAGRPTASSHLQEAREALSRRPKPNLSGAIYHVMGSLEAVARDISATPKATLGEILKKHDIVPKPLDTALSQMWGYASNEARHVEEGREPTREEAELVVGIVAAITTYLSQKNSK